MIETEVKLKIADPEKVLEKLLTLGFREFSCEREIDKYFDNDNGDIKRNDSALRIRIIENLKTGEIISQLNYKGKKLDTISMTRPEYETGLTDAIATENVLNALGYTAVKPYVIKERCEYQCGDISACLDNVDGLGHYLELEIMVEDKSEKEEALKRIEAVLSAIGYTLDDVINVSYLSQLMNK